MSNYTTNNQYAHTNEPKEKDQDLRPCGVKRLVMTGLGVTATYPG